MSNLHYQRHAFNCASGHGKIQGQTLTKQSSLTKKIIMVKNEERRSKF